MEAGDTAGAIAAARELAGALWERRANEAPDPALREAFRTLLRRRGYYSASPADLAWSLEEIHALGEGFDLYDLARELAALDRVATECLKLAPQPLFPEIRAFAPRCPCGAHPVTSR